MMISHQIERIRPGELRGRAWSRGVGEKHVVRSLMYREETGRNSIGRVPSFMLFY